MLTVGQVEQLAIGIADEHKALTGTLVDGRILLLKLLLATEHFRLAIVDITSLGLSQLRNRIKNRGKRRMSRLAEAIADLNEDEALRIVRERLDNDEEPMSLVGECRRGMNMVGERYKRNEYFLGDLIMAGEIFKEIMALIEPRSGRDSTPPIIGQIVLGTVRGDIHSLGKDIVASLLRSYGFEVFDLGIDVEPQAFVTKVMETGAPILGLSGLITLAYDSMKDTVRALEEKGIRDKVKVIIGGGIVDQQVKEYVGADAFSRDGAEVPDLCRELMREVE